MIDRLLLAALLLCGSEIVLWTNPPARPFGDWLILTPTYALLSALLLDLAARFRVRDLYGLMALAGLYGLLNALLINPDSALIDMPRTLFTRALGAHALIGLLALALYGYGGRWRLSLTVIGAAITGVLWGHWARWSPLEFYGGDESSLPTLALYGGFSLALIAAALALYGLRDRDARDLRLAPVLLAIVGAALLALGLLRAARGMIDATSALIVAMLAAFCLAILWFQRRKKGAALLDSPAPPPLRRFVMLALAFAIGAVPGWTIARGTPDLLGVIAALFAAYGLVWLPALSLTLGMRAFIRQARAQGF